MLVASRCIDSSHEAHAAMCVKNNFASTRDIDVAALRENLRAQDTVV